MLAGWYGRTGAGLLAVFIATGLAGYYFIPPYRTYGVRLDELPYFLSFLLSAAATSWLAEARRSAEHQKAHLDELFEHTPEAIMLLDLQGRVLRINKEFTRLFGFAVHEIVNRASIDLIVPSQLREEVLQSRRRLSQARHLTSETVRKRKDGSDLNVAEIAFPVVADGKCIAFYVIFRDAQGKRALEDLQRAQADLSHLSRITIMGELAASIAHEINQPIGAIVTNGNAAIRWLDQEPPYSEGIREALEDIVRDANRAAQVIGRIRSLLKNAPTPAVQLDVNEIIQEVLTLTSHEISRRGTTAVTELAKGLPPILGDRVQLQQVLLNLIMNALDAMSETTNSPRQLLIKSAGSVDSVLVQVHDSGDGWKPQHSSAIFDPFFTTKKDGIGMGLTISRSIIEMHGGRMWAEHASPGGATLSFSLPIAAPNEPGRRFIARDRT